MHDSERAGSMVGQGRRQFIYNSLASLRRIGITHAAACRCSAICNRTDGISLLCPPACDLLLGNVNSQQEFLGGSPYSHCPHTLSFCESLEVILGEVLDLAFSLVANHSTSWIDDPFAKDFVG
jgi:hypothetical protein